MQHQMNWLGLEAQDLAILGLKISMVTVKLHLTIELYSSYHPDYTYGITNRFNYKNFGLNIFIQGVMGRGSKFNGAPPKNGEANFGSYAVLNDRWRSESDPGNGIHPRADRRGNTHGNNNRPSSYQVEDGSYLKSKIYHLVILSQKTS